MNTQLDAQATTHAHTHIHTYLRLCLHLLLCLFPLLKLLLHHRQGLHLFCVCACMCLLRLLHQPFHLHHSLLGLLDVCVSVCKLLL